MSEVKRAKLGAYMSIECFRYLRFGAEDTAGRAIIISAGKLRGHSLKDFLSGISPDDETAITKTLAKILGLEGTRLCLVNSVKKTATGYEVLIEEGACASGVQSEEPVCAYTIGVFMGAIEALTGKRVMGTEKECEATGHGHCLYQLDILN